MLEESIPAIWSSMISWFTPTVLFLLLNLVIGTIAIISGFGSNRHRDSEQITKQQQQEHNQYHQIYRAPSVLERLKSIDLYRFRSSDLFASASSTSTPLDHHTQTTNPNQESSSSSSEEDVEEENEEEWKELEKERRGRQIEQEEGKMLDESKINYEEQHHEVTRSKSDTKPASGEVPGKLAKKMKKSASTKSAFDHFKKEEMMSPSYAAVEKRRPSTVREGKSNASDVMVFGDDEEVDAKADDFINRFKQQLRLQRLDSLLRYKEMISRGAASAAEAAAKQINGTRFDSVE